MLRAPVSLVVLCGLLAGCGRFPDPDASAAAGTNPAKWRGRLEAAFDFTSAATGRSHRVRVYLPAGYGTASSRPPVLYMADAQWAFNFYAETLDWKGKDVILVGVDQISASRRFLDFTLNGVDAYLKFLTKELVPAIEQKYPAGPVRGFMGVSLGGLLGAIQLSRETVGQPFFKIFLLFDPTLSHYPVQAERAETARRLAGEELNLTLVLTGANPGNGRQVAEFAARYRQRNHRGLILHHKDYAVTHDAIAAPSFADFVDVVFPNP
jgi:enterochelin esterase-like enzyme